MWPVSDEFLDTLKKSHTIVQKVEVYREGIHITDLRVHDGQVKFDYGALIQRSCSVTLGDETGELTPDDLTDALSVAGSELKLYRGLVLPDGTEELVPLGVFVIDVDTITESGDGHTIRIEGTDRSSKVSAAKFTVPYIIPEGTLCVHAVKELVKDRYPAVEFDSRGSETFQTSQIVFDVNKDPWEAAMELAKIIGCDLYFDGNGICVCAPVVDPRTATPVFTYSEGDESLLLYVIKRWTNRELTNWWIVTGETANDAPPVFAQAYDDDSSSPTYVYGPHGIHLKRFRSNLITTEDQAQMVADSLLYQSLGGYEDVRISTIVNPAHEVNDCILIQRDRIKVDGRYIIDEMTIPLTAERAAELGTRTQ